jgi:hypothetical protein
MNKDVKLEVDKVMKEKNVRSGYSRNTQYIYYYINKYNKYHSEFLKLQKTYTDSEIVDIQKYILNKRITNNTFLSMMSFYVNETFPKLLYISSILSGNKVVVDDELFKYYKAFYIVAGIEIYLDKLLLSEKKLKKMILYNNFKFDENTDIGKALNLYFGITTTLNNFDLLFKIEDNLGDKIFNYISNPKIIKFEIYEKNHVKNNQYENSFYDLFISKWNEFGLALIKQNLD